jgi:hypothetical protein
MAKSGIATGLNKGHVTTPIVKPAKKDGSTPVAKPSYTKGVRLHVSTRNHCSGVDDALQVCARHHPRSRRFRTLRKARYGIVEEQQGQACA